RICESADGGKLWSRNSRLHIERWTEITMRSTSERVRIRSLMHLSGVSWITASVLLHYTFDNEYPTLAHGASWSLGYDHRPAVNVEFWCAYVKAARSMCSECHITMRTLDCALRQYALDQGYSANVVVQAPSYPTTSYGVSTLI